MCLKAPVLGGTASAGSQEQYGRPQALGDLGTELRQDLLDRIDWKWLQARSTVLPCITRMPPPSCFRLARKKQHSQRPI